MKGSQRRRKLRELHVRRTVEANRLEEVIWVSAFEQIWPLVRRSLILTRREWKDEELAPGTRRVRLAEGASCHGRTSTPGLVRAG